MKKKTILIYVLLFFFLATVVYVTASLSTGGIVFFGRASGVGEINVEASRLFASPIIAKAGGQERISVTVFGLNKSGLGIANKPVSLKCKNLKLCQDAGVVFVPKQPITGEKGEAIFEIYSSVPGNFALQADVSGRVITQTVTIVFQ